MIFYHKKIEAVKLQPLFFCPDHRHYKIKHYYTPYFGFSNADIFLLSPLYLALFTADPLNIALY